MLPERTRGRIHGLFRQDPKLSIDDAHAIAKAEGHRVSRGSVQNIRREVQALPDKVRELDQDWDWVLGAERFGSNQVGEILKMQAAMRAYEPFPYFAYKQVMYSEVLQPGEPERPPKFIAVPEKRDIPKPVPPMTWRRAMWFDKTLPVTKSLDAHDRFWINEQFVSRERYGDWFGKEPQLEDLTPLLMYCPWESTEAAKQYELSIEFGQSIPLRFFGDLLYEFADAQRAYNKALRLGGKIEYLPEWPHEKLETIYLPYDELSLDSLTTRWHDETLAQLFKLASRKVQGDSDG